MTEAERDLMKPIGLCQQHRQEINKALKDLRKGHIPWDGWRTPQLPELETIQARRRVAVDAARDELRRKIEATPIDDEAWEAELRWRHELALSNFTAGCAGGA
jgi:hypothetical protein